MAFSNPRILRAIDFFGYGIGAKRGSRLGNSIKIKPGAIDATAYKFSPSADTAKPVSSRRSCPAAARVWRASCPASEGFWLLGSVFGYEGGAKPPHSKTLARPPRSSRYQRLFIIKPAAFDVTASWFPLTCVYPNLRLSALSADNLSSSADMARPMSSRSSCLASVVFGERRFLVTRERVRLRRRRKTAALQDAGATTTLLPLPASLHHQARSFRCYGRLVSLTCVYPNLRLSALSADNTSSSADTCRFQHG